MKNTIQFECPQEILVGLHCDAEQFSKYVQLEAAIALFKAGKISSGMAAKWLDIPRIHFLTNAFKAGAQLLDDNEDDLNREMNVL